MKNVTAPPSLWTGQGLHTDCVVLLHAGVIGGALGIGPLWELAVGLGNGLTALATQWQDPGWLIANESLLIAVLLVAGSPLAVRLFER